MTIIKCGNCKKTVMGEELTQYVFYKCTNCQAINEIFDIPIKAWLGFNYAKYLDAIKTFLRQYNFESILAVNIIERQAGRLSREQVNKIRGILIAGFNDELSLLSISDIITKDVKPKDLFRMKDGQLVKKNGKNVLAISAERRGIELARTETTRAGAEGSLLHYKKGDVEKVRFVASLGERTCPRCLDLNGVIFSLEESSGIIPVHGYCRCTWIPITTVAEQNISNISSFRIYDNGNE